MTKEEFEKLRYKYQERHDGVKPLDEFYELLVAKAGELIQAYEFEEILGEMVEKGSALLSKRQGESHLEAIERVVCERDELQKKLKN